MTFKLILIATENIGNNVLDKLAWCQYLYSYMLKIMPVYNGPNINIVGVFIYYMLKSDHYICNKIASLEFINLKGKVTRLRLKKCLGSFEQNEIITFLI